MVHIIRFEKNIQPYLNEVRWRIKDNISHTIWTIQILYNIIQSNQHPCYISKVNQQHISEYFKQIYHSLSR